MPIAFRDSFFQDVHIWQHKTRIDNPILSQHDGPIYQLRRWYEQFYVDVADVQPDMVDYTEIDVDMSKPIAAWEAEQAAARRHERSCGVRRSGVSGAAACVRVRR